MAQNAQEFGLAGSGMDVDSIIGNDPFGFLQSGGGERREGGGGGGGDSSHRNAALFDQYTASLGIGIKQPSQGNSSVEEYAALMGIKLEPNSNSSPSSGENEIMRSSGNLTSMTLPAGLGAASPMHMSNFFPVPVDTPPLAPPMGKPPLPPGDIGSRTLDPHVLQNMIQSNVQNSQFVIGNTTWPPPEDSESAAKADKSRERNRDHSRKSRLRKKMFVENLKNEVKELAIYKQMCDECMDLLAIVTTEPSATFTFVSSAYHRTLGFNSESLVVSGKSFFNIVHQEDRGFVQSEFNKIVSEGEGAGLRFRLVAHDNSIKMASANARLTERGIALSIRLDK